MNDPLLTAAAWLLNFLLHSTILLAAAALFDRLAAPRATALREQIWRAALLAPLLTATIATANLPRWGAQIALAAGKGAAIPAAPPVAVPPAREIPVANDAALPALSRSGDFFATGITESLRLAVAPSASRIPREARWSSRLPESWPNVLVLIWAAGALAGLARLGGLAHLARRELRGRRPAGAEVGAELEALADSRGLAAPRLSIAPSAGGPLSLLRREIVLPPWTLTALDQRQRRALLAHELAHQARRDPLWIVVALALQVLAWPQPLFVVARRRLARLAELEADAWAARAVADPRALAECLTECADRLVAGRVAAFGAAFAAGSGGESPFLERISNLLEGEAMRRPQSSAVYRAFLAGALALAAIALPGCDIDDLRAEIGGSSTNISISNSGDEVRISTSRPGYRLKVRAEGEVTFLPDESDIATLAPGGTFRIAEKLDGVERTLEISADRAGAITRTYNEEDAAKPFDDAAKAWLAAALPRMFRESGFDAEARVGRLLARGGAELVLAEVELTRGDFAKATYLGYLLGGEQLAPAELDRAIAAIGAIESDFHRRQALEQALGGQTLDADRYVRLLDVAGRLDSDFERTELLLKALDRIPDSAAVRTAWLAAAKAIGSDYERGRALGAALDQEVGDPAFAAELIGAAAEKSASDFELRQMLQKAGPRLADPAVAAAYVAATTRLDSSFERSQALIELLRRKSLDAGALAGALESAAEIDGHFEKMSVLQAAARKVAPDPELSRRYREIARDLGDFERGQALSALDEAAR